MYILGINAAYHESAACLLHDDTIVAAAEEERFTRVKHAKPARVDNAHHLPIEAIRFCLEQAGLSAADGLDLSTVSHIAYSFAPNRRRDWHAAYRHDYQVEPGGFGGPDGEATFHASCLKVPGIFRECGFRGHFHFIGHHLCHAASSFYMTPLATAAVMVIDGIGEHESTTIYRGSSAGLELMWQQSYPHSLGFLWEKLAMHLGFSEYDAAKIMALAAYGDPTRYRAALAEIVTVTPEIAVDDQIVRFRSRDHSAIEAALGIPKRRSPIHELEPEDQPYADLAASLQEVTETAMLALAARARDIDSALCLSGGVALNCVGIGRILESNLFDAIYVPPASHDAGTAIGAALYLRHVVFGSTDRPVQLSPYLGPSFTAGEIDETLFDNAVAFEREDGDVEERIATLIASGYTVAWCHGRMEFGPRALGHRSVLADPRTLESVRKLTSIKHRASFDPFAPAVLQEELANWFDVPSTENVSAHYMVSSYRAHDNKRARIPAVVHVDGTSRVQSVSRIYAPRLHRMIRAFWRLTGVPIVLNTSFNDREPIVGSPTDALATAIRAGVDYLVMEDRIVNLREQAIDINVPDLTLEAYFEKLR